MEFSDEYSHNIPGVMYFSKSFPSKEVEYLYDYSLEGCKCEEVCLKDTCACMQMSGTFYKYEDVNDIKNYIICENDVKGPTYECNDNCSCCNRICGNKLVQLGPRKNLAVKFCGGEKGLGLFTLEEIKAGNFVCEYAGEIISENEALERFKTNSEQNKMNYIFCIREHFGEKVVKTFIDPTYYGNIGRYINHSCEPNCKLVVVRTNDAMPILGIFAKEDIRENSEITYNYGEGEICFENDRKYVRKTCSCNSEKCKKYLPCDITLVPE